MWGATVVRLWAALACTGVETPLAEATRLLKTSQEEAALAVLTRALDRSGLKNGERAQLYLLLGIARVNLRDEEGGELAFQRGVEADPAAVLPARLASPRARTLFDAAKERARQAALAPKVEPLAPPAPVIAAPPPVLQVPVAPPPPAGPSGVRTASYAVAAVALAAGGTGVFFGVRANAFFAQLSAAARGDGGRIIGLDQRTAASINAQGAQSALFADVLFGCAGAVAIAALTMWLVGGR